MRAIGILSSHEIPEGLALISTDPLTGGLEALLGQAGV